MDTRDPKVAQLTALQKQSLAFGDKLLEQSLPAIEKHLLEMADAARGDQQLRLLQLVREAKAKRSDLVAGFRIHLSEGFDLFRQGRLGGKDTREEDMSTDLSLVANDALEQELAAASMSRRAEARCAEALYLLNQRMALLRDGKKLPDDGNPLGPYQFAHAFRHALQVLRVEGSLPMPVFRLFEKVLLAHLGSFYQAANTYLVEQGVLPNLRYGTGVTRRPRPAASAPEKPQPPAAATKPAEATAHAAPQAQGMAPASTATGQHEPALAAAPMGNPAAEQQLYQSIRQLQQHGAVAAPASAVAPAPEPAAGGSVGAAAGGVAGGVAASAPAASAASPAPAPAGYVPGYFSQPFHPGASHVAVGGQGAAADGQPMPAGQAPLARVTQGEVVQALGVMPVHAHAEVIENTRVPPPMTVEQYQSVSVQLRQHLGEDKHLPEEESHVIDLVGMIFEFMLADKQLPDAVKAVLSYLHTPYLKAAFLDRALFEKPDHPARQLLNCLADAGIRWVNRDGDSQFKVFPKIKLVVRRVLTDFDSDLGLFDELLADMQEFCHNVERSVGVMERRAREKAQGEERLREVKRKALHELRKRMAGRALPSWCVVLLLHPWFDYLTFILLRAGEQSSDWTEGLGTVDDLLWSIQPKSGQGENNRQKQMQAGLQERVRKGLETVLYDAARTARLLEGLQQAQALALQNMPPEPAAPEARAEMEKAASADLEDMAYDPELLSAAEHELVEKLRLIEFGTWFEFDQLDQYRQLRAKVAWFNPQNSRYMLTDLGGRQLAMKSGLDIARLMLAGQARILSGSAKPFFERALEHIFARLKASAAQLRAVAPAAVGG